MARDLEGKISSTKPDEDSLRPIKNGFYLRDLSCGFVDDFLAGKDG
jgi:hypothetical protein